MRQVTTLVLGVWLLAICNNVDALITYVEDSGTVWRTGWVKGCPFQPGEYSNGRLQCMDQTTALFKSGQVSLAMVASSCPWRWMLRTPATVVTNMEEMVEQPEKPCHLMPKLPRHNGQEPTDGHLNQDVSCGSHHPFFFRGLCRWSRLHTSIP